MKALESIVAAIGSTVLDALARRLRAALLWLALFLILTILGIASVALGAWWLALGIAAGLGQLMEPWLAQLLTGALFAFGPLAAIAAIRLADRHRR